jgi:hypothetical protein
MMTFGAAATAYAQTPTATKTLTGKLTIGSPTATTSSPTLSQTVPNAGATNNQLSFEVKANVGVAGKSSTDRAGVQLTLTGPYSLNSKSVAEVIDLHNGVTLGTLSSTASDQSATDPHSTVVFASNTTASISSGDMLDVVINNVVNSATTGSGGVAFRLGTVTGTTFTSGSAATLDTANDYVTSATSPSLTLSPNDNPGQLTTATYTFQVENSIAASTAFTVDLADQPLSGSAGTPSIVSTGGVSLTVGGTNETSSVTVGYSAGELTFTPSAKLNAGVYTITVPVSGSSSPGIESVSAQYMGVTGGAAVPTFVASPSVAAWGYPEIVKSVKASNPYDGTASTVTVDFTDLNGGTTPLTVSGLGLSGQSAVAVLENTSTSPSTSLGAVVFDGSSNVSTSSFTLTSGDSYSLTFSNLTLPTASTSVGIGTDFSPMTSAALPLGSASPTSMDVSATTTSVGVSSNWTLSGVEAATQLASGSILTVDTTVGSGVTTTSYLPTSPGAYKIVDLSNSADTQTPSSVSASGGQASLTLASAIPSGDILDLVINGVSNNPVASTATVALMASGAYLEAAQLTAPSAAADTANGSIANASGALYEWAGGYAFHLPTVADAGKIEAC